MEKVLGPEPYTWDKDFDPAKLEDYEVACTSNAMGIMHKYLMGQIEYLKQRNKDIIVVDGGCGYARWVIYLNKKGIKCIGVDRNKKVISQVKEFDPSVPLKIADIRNLPFEDNSFDLFYSFGVLEHLEEGMDRALVEIRRILKPKGRLLITVPTINHIKRISTPLRRIRIIFKSGDYKHFREYRYEKNELFEVLTRVGFKIVHFGVSDDCGIGLWEDFSFLRRPGIFRLNSIGKMICKGLNALSPWITTWGILVIGEKR